MAGHKGGAWKVAYADFITAMMALFMVLWIIGSEQEFLEQLQEYFRNPPSPFHSRSSGVILDDSALVRAASTEFNPEHFHDRADPQILAAIVRDFYRLLNLDPDDEQRPVDIQVTSDGLRLIIFDRSRQPLFLPGSSEFTEWGSFVMQNLSWMIERYPFQVVIDGHTSSLESSTNSPVNPWRLSVFRAESARESLVYYALNPSQIIRVSGYADTRPLADLAPEDDSHRRITIGLSLVSEKTE